MLACSNADGGPTCGRRPLERLGVMPMSFFAELVMLARSLVDLARSVIEACSAKNRREEYVPQHMAARHSGSAHRNKRDR